MLSARQNNITSVRRDAWVEVDLNALEENLALIKSWLGEDVKIMAVVKSDAYGHGAPQVAELFSALGVHSLGVASIDEGCQLRQTGLKTPIVILSPTPSWGISMAIENSLEMTVTSLKQIKDIQMCAKRLERQACIHLKVDTGMHRLGVSLEELPLALAKCKAQSHLELVSLFSHLAQAGDQEATGQQNALFQQAQALCRKEFPQAYYHLASSEAARRFPATHYNLVRVGLYLYGLEPDTVSKDLRQAISVRGRINHINRIVGGESVGYGWTWTAGRDSVLASIPIGYADGIDRKLSNNMEGLLLGKRIKQVGRISMDQMLFDITDVSQAQEGDVITLIGNDFQQEQEENIHLAQWSQSLETITYELACRLRVRLPRIYTRNKRLNKY
jgi:alanine racemase